MNAGRNYSCQFKLHKGVVFINDNNLQSDLGVGFFIFIAIEKMFLMGFITFMIKLKK